MPLAAANLPFWVLGQWVYLNRGVVNLDAAVAIVVCAWAPLLGIPLLVLSWIADALVSQSLTYHFTNPADFLLSARFVQDLWIGDLFGIETVPVGLLFGAAALMVVWSLRRLKLQALPAAVVIVTIAVLDAINGSSSYSTTDVRVAPVNLAGSPVATLARQWFNASAPGILQLGPGESVATEAGVQRWAKENSSGSVLFVVVESMGLHASVTLRGWLRAQLVTANVENRYEVRSFELPFRGATTAAELRALCGLGGSYGALSAQAGAACLPARMVEMGWDTVGYHGFSRRMFDRGNWWPRLGLQRTIFHDDMGDGTPQCGGAFRGACDAAVLARAAADVRKPRTFAYVLTLNTHLPVESMEVPADLRDLCTAQRVTDSVCLFTAALGRTMGQIGEVLGALDQPLMVVVIGDHSPPFQVQQARAQFSSDRVPVFVLTSRR